MQSELLNRGAWRTGVLATIVLAAPACAEPWTVTQFSVPNQRHIQVDAVSSTQLVGFAIEYLGPPKACMWDASGTNWRTLHPFWAYASMALGCAGNQQVGYIVSLTQPDRAVLWRGTPGPVILHPPTATDSKAQATDGVMQGGSASNQAALWSSTAASYVNLHGPLGGTSAVHGMTPGEQVGHYNLQACRWAGTPTSRVNLHPLVAETSFAVATDGAQQGGYVRFNNTAQASVWTGTAASWVNLHPATAVASYVQAVGGGFQVGHVAFPPEDIGLRSRASLWRGSADSYEDLHAAVPPNITTSFATGVSVENGFIRVTGYGSNDATGQYAGLIWTRPLPQGCDSIDFNTNGVFPEDQDIVDFFNVLAGGTCATCNDIDFNNNGVFPEDQDVVDFLNVLAGGQCP